MSEHEHIWLAPWCDECEQKWAYNDGRQWCQDDVFEDCDEIGCGRKPVKYALQARLDAAEEARAKAYGDLRRLCVEGLGLPDPLSPDMTDDPPQEWQGDLIAKAKDLQARLDAAEEERDLHVEEIHRLRGNLDAALAENERLHDEVEQCHAKSTCCCGDYMKGHSGRGHSPVSMYDYALFNAEDEIARLRAVAEAAWHVLTCLVEHEVSVGDDPRVGDLATALDALKEPGDG